MVSGVVLPRGVEIGEKSSLTGLRDTQGENVRNEALTAYEKQLPEQ